ncbi:hypothetical protein HHL23_08470 [Chryseobacterium sp. RP-3-3]|uniref:Uncharacterized protein n=1 Tax=Chryseobacterium antibioticum TaxID=2728847 RepID=A0A7Y0AMC6_9FLAO|nr:hypothetical protein [Chryseobacterium antibioticum]NML69830.1 hypothetical protein [Chryseobacterium antibioticum]
MSNIGKIIRVNALPPQGERETNVIYQVAAPGAATYTDYAIDENGDMKTPAAGSGAQNLSDDLIKISDPGLVSEGFLTQAQFNQNMNEDLDLKLNTPVIDGNAQNFTKIVGLDDNGNTAKLPAGDLGKNVANSSLTTVSGAGLTLGANWALNTSGLYYSITGLADVSSDSTFNTLLAQNASGRMGKSNGKGAFMNLPNQLTESEKSSWRTLMNGGWTTATMSVAIINPVIIKKQNNISYISLKGANLNLNPTNFQVAIVDLNGNVVLNIPSSQVQLYTTGLDLVFWANLFSLSLGTYKIRLRNGVAEYTTPVTFQLVDTVTTIDPSTLAWNTKVYNDATTSKMYAAGNTVYYGLDANVKPNADEPVYLFKAKTQTPIFPANSDFYFEFELPMFWVNGNVNTNTFGLSALSNHNDLNNDCVGGVDIGIRQDYMKWTNYNGAALPSLDYNQTAVMILIKRGNILTRIFQTRLAGGTASATYTDNVTIPDGTAFYITAIFQNSTYYSAVPKYISMRIKDMYTF